jgi:hypothetical protein
MPLQYCSRARTPRLLALLSFRWRVRVVLSPDGIYTVVQCAYGL